jgi:predicted metal-dependent hydrolase
MTLQCLEKHPPELGFDVRILRSKRRSISIEVRDAQVSIRAPMRAPESVLWEFLQEKATWVRSKIQEQQQRVEETLPPVVDYKTGSPIPLMGEQLTLVLGRGSISAIRRVDNQLHLLLSQRSRKPEQQQIREQLARWYQQQALEILTRKTNLLTQQMGLKYQELTIKATRSKWGHCTSRGAIQYNWHILLAPEAVVDYLVAHETSHLRHHNHSPAFWSLVGSVCPDYQALRLWLKRNGSTLVL